VTLTRRGFVRWLASFAPALPAAANQAAASAYPVQFTDIAAQAGLRDIVYYGGVDAKTYIVEVNGCGVAFFDYDNDGWPDLLVLNGSRLKGFEKGKEPTNHLYRNNRDGTFTDVTRKAGLERSGWACSCCIGDYDNDGNDDLFITYWGENVLYHNNGDGTFTNVTEKAGVGGDPKRWNAGATFVDYDRDGKLDLFVSAYVDVDLAELPVPGSGTNCTYKGVPVYCGPRGLKGTANILYRNNGNGTFTDVSRKSGILNPTGYYGMSVTTLDYNNDGASDILVINDSSPSILFRNNGNGTFTDVGVPSGVAYDENGAEQSGMGVAVADYDGDGLLDVVKTQFSDSYPAIYRNLGNGYFQEVSTAAGLDSVTQYVQWGAGLVDFDNDSWPDLFYVTAHVFPELEKKRPEYPFKGPRFLFRNLGNGKFVNVTEQCGSGLNTLHASHGCAFGDFDNDGDLDVLIMNQNGPPSLLRADVKSGHGWLKVKLTGTVSNRSAIGARVAVTSGTRLQVQEVQSQSSYYSVNDFRLHFGLGAAGKADSVVVRWPNGRSETLRDVASGQLIHVREGQGITRTEKFPLKS
jgi:hypothetical protein